MKADLIDDCVLGLIGISHAEEPLQHKLHNAESRICGFLLENTEGSGWFEALQDLLDRLAVETNLQSDPTQEFLVKVSDFIDRQLERASATKDALALTG
jgi:hypothetical protein